METKDILKRRREELNLTMKELSKKVGVSEATISRWESGDIQNMRRDKILSLSLALDLPLSVIMGWDSEKREEEHRACELFEKCYGKEAFAIVQKFLQLDADQRQLVGTMIDTMIQQIKEKDLPEDQAM